MTRPRTLFSIIKSLWLRSTGQPGWCTCIICRDELLDQPVCLCNGLFQDPLGFSQDARKFQKQLRKMPKAYKCKPCIPSEDHHQGEDGEVCCAPLSQGHLTRSPCIKDERKHIPQRPPPTKPAKTVSFSVPLEQDCPVVDKDTNLTGCSDGYTYIHESKMKEREKEQQRDEEENNKWIVKPILRRVEMETDLPTSSTNPFPKNTEELPYFDDNDYSLYEARSPMKFPLSASHFYHDDDSMRSYGTITSDEILEAFGKASEELDLASLSNFGNPAPACFDDDYLYTDLVYLSSVDTTYV